VDHKKNRTNPSKRAKV